MKKDTKLASLVGDLKFYAQERAEAFERVTVEMIELSGAKAVLETAEDDVAGAEQALIYYIKTEIGPEIKALEETL